MKNPSELVGKVVKIEDIHYLVDKVAVSDGAVGSVQKFVVVLITLDFLTKSNQKIDKSIAKPIQDFAPKEEIKGIAIEFSEEQLYNKVTTVKALRKALTIGIMDAKHLVDAAERNTVKFAVINPRDIRISPMQYLKVVIKRLEESIPKNNFTASFYY